MPLLFFWPHPTQTVLPMRTNNTRDYTGSRHWVGSGCQNNFLLSAPDFQARIKCLIMHLRTYSTWGLGTWNIYYF